MQNRCYTAVFSLLFVLLLSACAGGSSKATRYYLIDPVAFDHTPSLGGSTDLSVEVIDLHIPQYLERFQIAIRASEGRLAFSDYHQWGESLRKNLLRTLARNLSQLLATHDVGTPLNRSASSPDYRLQVYIEQFELDTDNTVKLVARWQLTQTRKQGEKPPQEPNGIFAARLQSEDAIEDGDYDAMVAAMRKLYGQLSKEIAATILAPKKSEKK